MTIQLYYYTVICSMFRGGYLGLSWGLPGGFLGVRRGKPHLAPRKPSLMPLCFPFKYRIEASMVYLIEMSKNKKKEFILSTSFIKHMDDTPVLSWQIIFFQIVHGTKYTQSRACVYGRRKRGAPPAQFLTDCNADKRG